MAKRAGALAMNFGEMLLVAIGAHPVGGLRVEMPVEIFLERDPLVAAADLAAPRTDPEVFLEIVQPLQHPLRDQVNHHPSDEGDGSFHERFMPVDVGGGPEEKLRQAEKLVEP